MTTDAVVQTITLTIPVWVALALLRTPAPVQRRLSSVLGKVHPEDGLGSCLVRCTNMPTEMHVQGRRRRRGVTP